MVKSGFGWPVASDSAHNSAHSANNNTGPTETCAFKRLLLVGTSESRPFVLAESIRMTRALGVELVLLDNPEARALSRDVIPDALFIGAPIDNHDPDVVAAILAQVEQFEGGRIDAVFTFLNPYAELAGLLVDALGAAGNSGAAAAAAHTKSTARELLLKYPDIATPYRVVKSVEQAVLAYEEMGGGKFVMKPIHGGGSALVVTDVDSPVKAAAVYQEIEDGIRDFAVRPDAGVFLLDQDPGIMIERQLEGPEVDVELVLENGKVKFWHVSDNGPADKPYPVEKGVIFPSQLSQAWQEALAAAAGKAVAALGLTTGNMHVEMIATPDGPRIIEVNARMGGAFVWQLILDLTGINLVEQGLRSVLGLPVAGNVTPKAVIDARFIVPKATGDIEVFDGMEQMARTTGISHVVALKARGENVHVVPDDWLGWVTGTGATFADAESAVLSALDKVRIAVRTADGTLIEQTGAYTQEPVDTVARLAPEVRLGPPLAAGHATVACDPVSLP